MDATDQKSDENCITDDGVCEEAPDKVGQPLGPPAVSHEMGDDTIVDTVDDGALDLPNDDTIVEQVNDASLDLPDDDTIVDQVYNNPSDLPNDSGEEAVGQLDEDLGRPDHSESEEITPFSQLEQANNMREGFGDLQEQTLTTVMHQTSAGIDFELGSIPHAISSESSTKLHVTSALAASRPQVHPSPDDGWFSTMKQQGEWERPTLRNCRESVYSDAHPVQDVFALRRLLPFADSPVLRKEEYAGSQPRVAFFTGATGFIGSLVLASLLHIAPSTTFVCLVRANSKESALQRVIVGLQESNLWHPSFQNQIKAMKGDFEKPLMGLSMTDFRHLAESADVVYHFGGSGPNKRELELYSGSPRASNLIALQHVLRLCITTRPKPLHVVSSLDVWEPVLTYGRYGTPIDPSSDIQRIPEKGCKVSVRDLESQFPVASSTVAGHAWSKIAAEEVFSYSRRCGLAVVVYRVPPVFLTCAAAVDLRSIFSTLLLAACGLGIFPVDERGLCPLPLLAADAVATRIARLSLLPRSQRQYNAYHVLPSVENIETGTLCVDAASLSSWAKEFGFLGEFRPVNLEVFLDAVQKSRLSGMHTILSQLRDFALWSLPPGNNTYTWTILNDCLQKDITLTSRMLQEAHRGNRTDPEAGTTSPIRNSAVGAWPSPRRVFHRGLASLLRKCSQRVDTLAISGSLSMCTVDLCVAEALRRFPSLELDSTSNEILQFVSAGWRVFFHALRTDGAPLLEATIFIDRLIVSHSITLLHFLKRERHLRDRTYSEDDTRRKDKIEEVANSPLFICGLNEDTCTMLQELLRIDNRLCIVPTAGEPFSQ
ncbi:MAG: uncharacterized protein KVP18_002454 [Porospora cf. gigantea A]|uniref:uncharacterized protein n=1 Tax=Porospora cf. gigantea A TaxID=2853593 RepID=UPI0035599386|nr:MAG: hypothetical protein KVP18_002454 [Porospora cf. gigantea A]